MMRLTQLRLGVPRRPSRRRRWLRPLAVGLALVVLASGASGVALASEADAPSLAAGDTEATVAAESDLAAVPAADWLHVSGNAIVDEAGNPVWLTGANWFGFNATERVFHGLWSGNITTMTREMAERGINIVRVPISTQLLLEWKSGSAPTSNVNVYVNPELSGMDGLQIFDFWLGLCEQYGLKVLVDVHSAEADNSGHVAPMWYKGSITPEQFYQAWVWLAGRYRDNDTIVAFDLENEPHGKANESPRAKWDDSSDVDNWKYAAETAARRILAVNPNVLILVEGIEIYARADASWDSTASSDYYSNWWGGNLRGVRDFPIDLGANQDQLVYSPHDYGPLVYEQPWFASDFTKATLTDDVWRPNWLYIHENEIAPLLIGEWGGRLGQDARQDAWMTDLRDLIVEYGLHHTFWCLNPNSGDTGGLLLDDWATWDEEKYALLKKALWQYDGRFVGLDHQVPLGGADSTTGMTVAERYTLGPVGGDTEAPTAPGTPTATEIAATSVRLSWSPSTDNVGVAGYDVLRSAGDGGTTQATVVATVSRTSTTVTGLTGDTRYAFSVRARDASGNLSPASPEVSVTTSAGGLNSGCLAAYKVTQSWAGGFVGEVVVTNTSTTAIAGWTVTWTNQPGTSIDSLWNGQLTVSGSNVTVTSESANGNLPVNGSTTVGFVGSGGSTAPETITCVAR